MAFMVIGMVALTFLFVVLSLDISSIIRLAVGLGAVGSGAVAVMSRFSH